MGKGRNSREALQAPRLPPVVERVPSRRVAVASVEDLYREHATKVRRVLSGLGVPRDSLDDGVQQVFIVALDRPEKLAECPTPDMWLMGIARNVARRARRRLSFRWRTSGGSPDDQPTADDPDARLTLERVLAALTGKEREAVVFVKVGGMTASAAAGVLGISESAVYERLRSAKHRLKRRFPKLGYGRESETL